MEDDMDEIDMDEMRRSKKYRYFVWECCNIFTVRDKAHPNPDYSGQNSDTRGVVGYWCLPEPERTICPTCRQTILSFELTVNEKVRINTSNRKAAYQLCNKLNGEQCSKKKEHDNGN